MNWIEVSIVTTMHGSDIVAQALYEVGVIGVVIEDPSDLKNLQGNEGDWDYIDESLINKMNDEVLVKGYLLDDASFYDKLHYIRDRIKNLLNMNLGMDIGSGDIRITNVKEEDWANNWKKYYKPSKVGEKIVIKPSWEKYDIKKNEIVLEMDPGMAFGTGTHETTILCIKALEKYLKSGGSILDIGCGTGILAISALLLDPNTKSVAVDVDEKAVKIARKNARMNSVDDRINVIQGNLLDQVNGKFDVVIANIIADVVIEISDYVKNYINPDGIFISSGIILDRIDDVLNAFENNGLEILEKNVMGEWVCVVSRRRSAA